MKRPLLLIAVIAFSPYVLGAEPNYSVHLNPLNVLGRALTMEAMFPVKHRYEYSYGPAISLTHANYETTENYEYLIGIRANKHFNEAFQSGGYIGAQLSYAYIKETKFKIYQSKGHDFRLTSVIGYLWRYENFTFNIAIGGGFTTYGHPKKVNEDGEAYEDTISIPDIPLILDGDFSIGWIF